MPPLIFHATLSPLLLRLYVGEAADHCHALCQLMPPLPLSLPLLIDGCHC